MKKHLTTILSISIVFFSSCTSINTLVVDVEKPALITLPPSVNDLLIVNNAVLQPKNVGHKDFIKGRETNVSIEVPNDSVDIILMEGLLEELSSHDYFEHIGLYEYPTRTDKEYDKEVPLTASQLLQIAETTNADAILTLDKIAMKTRTDSSPSIDLFDAINNTLDLDIDVSFRIYSKKGEAISPPFVLSDSIYWVETVSRKQLLSESNPSREDAMKTGASYIANKVSIALIPYHTSEARAYFGDVKETKKLVENNKWSEAQAIWLKEFNQETKPKRKARLANNISLAYELSDNLNEALKWIQVSIDLFSQDQETAIDKQNLQTANSYKDLLIERMNDFRILDIRNKGNQL